MTIELITLGIIAVTSLLGLMTSVVGLWKALVKIEQVHLSVNSRLDQWMKTLAESEHAKGVLQGVENASGGSTLTDNSE